MGKARADFIKQLSIRQPNVGACMWIYDRADDSATWLRGFAPRAGKGGAAGAKLLASACFTAGTQIATPTGLVAIQNIKVGDLVLSYDVERGQIVSKPVTELIRNSPQVTYEVKVKSVGGMIDTVRTTAEHPWLMASHQWAGTDELHASDRVESATGEDLTVISIKATGKVEPIYNFTVADTHTYLVGKNHAVVHNSCLYDANKLIHIFGNPDHLMGPLVKKFGSEKAAMGAIHDAAQVLSKAEFKAGTVILVGGEKVWVRGAVVDGINRIGSASMNIFP